MARKKLNSIEKISKALIDSNTINEEFALMINKGQNYFRLKESFRTKYNQVSDIECNGLIEHGKKIGKNKKLRLKVKTKV